MICDHVGGIRDPLKQDLTHEFCRNQNKVISILTETHISHDQIHHKRNICWAPSFFSPGDSHPKVLLVLIHLGLEDITEVDTDPKEDFVSFNVNPSNDRILYFMPVQGIAPGNSWIRGVSLKNYKIICKIKIKEMKTK